MTMVDRIGYNDHICTENIHRSWLLARRTTLCSNRSSLRRLLSGALIIVAMDYIWPASQILRLAGCSELPTPASD